MRGTSDEIPLPDYNLDEHMAMTDEDCCTQRDDLVATLFINFQLIQFILIVGVDLVLLQFHILGDFRQLNYDGNIGVEF